MRQELKEYALSGSPAVKPANNVGIIGIGGYVPEKVLKNDAFIHVHLSDKEKGLFYSDPNFDTNERRWSQEESAMDMAVKAAKDALETYNIDPLSIDVVISTHSSQNLERLAPPDANYIQTAIGAENAYSFTVDCGFDGWLHAVTTAVAFLSSGFHKRVLVVAGEKIISSIDAKNPKILFMGDGAGAWILESQDEPGIMAFHHMSKELFPAAGVQIGSGWGNFWSQESHVKPFMVVRPESFVRDTPILPKYIAHSVEKSLDSLELTTDDVNLFIFAQKYKGLNMAWTEEIGISYDRVHDTIAKHACLECANIPVILWDAVKKGRVKKGDILTFADLGSNWDISAAVIKWTLD